MEDINEMLAEQQRELERIRGKRDRHIDTDAIRLVLNILFLVLALAGIIFYFFVPEQRILGWLLIGIGMILKIIEFLLRFLF